MRRVLIVLGILLLPAIPLVLVVTGVLKTKQQTVAPVHLTVWGTTDDTKAIQALIAKYQQTRSYAKIDYQVVSPQNYDQQLISAWAQGTGPDVYFVPANWVGKMSAYSVPMPADLTVPQVITSKGLFGKSTSIVSNAKAAPSITSLNNDFVECVTDTVIRDNQVWGLPLSLDTLVVYYNKDLLNNAKVFQPATTWTDLQSQLTNNHLTVVDAQGHLVQSGVALGTVNNLPYATDLLALLMLQNGSLMTQANRQSHLNDDSGLQAAKFYLSFAQSSKSNYSWDESQTSARDAFIQGKVAYYFGTLADRPAIEASTLNWNTTPMFHIRSTGDNDGATGTERFIDSAQFQVAMVSKATTQFGHTKQAWNFVDYITQAGNVPTYIQATNTLSALRPILAQQSNDQTLGLYAKQLLTARVWYHGNDGPAADQYLRQFITSALTGKVDIAELLNLANTQIQSTL